MQTITAPALAANRLRRLAGMSAAEIGCRGHQAGSKLIDRLRPPVMRDPHDTLRRHAPRLVDAGEAVASLRSTFDRCFFEGTRADAIVAMRNACPDHVDRILAQAETLVSGHFDLLGYRNLHFGDPIDWHLDPVWSRRTPLWHWSRIDPLDASVVGDSKIVWELNRHQWMVTLAQASALSGDDRYARYALRTLLDWIAANPIGYGINWASSLEISLRLISWTWVIALLRHTPLLDSVVIHILTAIRAHADHVRRYLSHYYSPNTHLTGEALGLFYAGTMFPEFDDARRWRDGGAAILIEQVRRQVSSDGVYFEQSTCYQRYTRDIYLHFTLLAERSGYHVPPHVHDGLDRLEEFLSEVALDDGSTPAIGDADGGSLLPLSAGSDDAPAMRWLTGAAAITGKPPAVRSSRLFRDGGYAILRSGPHQMIVDVGPLGSFGHGHADLLSIQCSVFGERCLVDAGTYCYTAAPEWREYFRGSAAHNTITIDGRSQAVPQGPFGWQHRPAVTINDWRSGDGVDVIDAQHAAYDGVIHRRRVMSLSPGMFIVIDDLTGEGVHAFELMFQFAPMHVELISATAARATTPGGRRLWIMPAASAALRADIVAGSLSPIRGWVSADYGQRQPAPALVYSCRAPLPVTVTTILRPEMEFNQPCAALPAF